MTDIIETDREKKQIILASQSPRRRALLERIGLTDFIIRVPEKEEQPPHGFAPRDMVEYLSREKAKGVSLSSTEIVIAADTMVFLDGVPLGKPIDKQDALKMLLTLQGRRHTVCTGVTVCQGTRFLTASEESIVFFRSASHEELWRYVQTGEPMDKAGAYGIQGRGALLVERLEGDFFNVMGLPLLLLSRMLAEFGVILL